MDEKTLRKNKYIVGNESTAVKLNYIELQADTLDPRTLKTNNNPDKLYIPKVKNYYEEMYGKGNALSIPTEFKQIKIKPTIMPIDQDYKQKEDFHRIISQDFQLRQNDKTLNAIENRFAGGTQPKTTAQFLALQGTKTALTKELEAIEEYASTHYLTEKQKQKLKDELISRNYMKWKTNVKELDGQKQKRAGEQANTGAGGAAGGAGGARPPKTGFDIAPRTGITRSRNGAFKADNSEEFKLTLRKIGENQPFNTDIEITSSVFNNMAKVFFYESVNGVTPFESIIKDLYENKNSRIPLTTFNALMRIIANYNKVPGLEDDLKTKLKAKSPGIFISYLTTYTNKYFESIYGVKFILFDDDDLHKYFKGEVSGNEITTFFKMLLQYMFDFLNSDSKLKSYFRPNTLENGTILYYRYDYVRKEGEKLSEKEILENLFTQMKRELEQIDEIKDEIVGDADAGEGVAEFKIDQ